jgi:acyl carrier protein
MLMNDSQSGTIRSFVLHEFLEGEDEELLKDDTALLSTGVINSLAVIRLVAFLENEFGVKIEPHEMSGDYMDTIGQMVRLVDSKRQQGK